MDVGGIRKFADRISTRSMVLAIAACALLAIPIIWNTRQSRLTQQALDRAAAAEKDRSDAEEARALKDVAVRRSRHDDPREIARVRQLYQEIENLTQIQESVEEDLHRTRRIAEKRAANAAAQPRTP
jgi:hypothetical protein